MEIKSFITGQISHQAWQKLSIAMIIEFVGGLMLCWALRPIWVSSTWNYLPFRQAISDLGWGRTLGNPGAWMFLFVFIGFAILGSGWNAYVSRQFTVISKNFGKLYWICLDICFICFTFVGIFDRVWPNQDVSNAFHNIGADAGIFGNACFALIGWIFLVYAYKNPNLRRPDHASPYKLFLFILILAGALTGFIINGTPAWQWSCVLALMGYLLGLCLYLPRFT